MNEGCLGATTDSKKPAATRPRLRAAVVLLVVLSATACSTRTVDDRIINRYGLDVYLRSEKKVLGPTLERGYEHPSDIDVARLRRILGSIELEHKEGARTVRTPAFAAELLEPVSAGLAEAFREADANEQIVVVAVRKQMQKAIFDRKYLTSFVTYMQDGYLYLHLARHEWEVPEVTRQKPFPKPSVGETQASIRTVGSRYIETTGRGSVRVEWQNEVFSPFAGVGTSGGAGVGVSGPGTSGAGAGVSGAADAAAPEPASDAGKTVLMEASPSELPPPAPITAGQLEKLGPEDLRRLADLEEARKAGQLTEDDYRARRAAVLEAAGAN